MIRTLVDYDSITAAGILARMALALDEEGNPASKSRIPNENLVRERVLHEIRTSLGLAPDDNSAESIERVSEALDAESDSLYGAVNVEKTLSELSRKGHLPSDLFYVQVGENIRNFYGEKFPNELKNIEATVASPDQEQHFGGGEEDESKGQLFSLFSKKFSHDFPFKSFTLLVMGQRHGTLLTVNHAWRIYLDRVDLSGAIDLIDVVRRFADVFGRTIVMDGKKGKFILTKYVLGDEGIKKDFEVLPLYRPDQRGRLREIQSDFEFTCFSLLTRDHAEIAFLAIDSDRYRKSLEAHDW